MTLILGDRGYRNYFCARYMTYNFEVSEQFKEHIEILGCRDQL